MLARTIVIRYTVTSLRPKHALIPRLGCHVTFVYSAIKRILSKDDLVVRERFYYGGGEEMERD